MRDKDSRRLSSIPKIPDDDSQEVITTIPTSITMPSDHDKTLPPIPFPSNITARADDSSSIISSASTNRSSINLGTPMKSNPVCATTTTYVNSTEIQPKENAVSELTTNQQLQKLKTTDLEDVEESSNENVAGGVSSFLKTFKGYVTRSEVNDNEATSLTLGDGIHFEIDSPTEMLTYRKASINKGNHKHSRSMSGAAEPLSPAGSMNLGLTPKIPSTPKTEVNYNLYVDEKYLDTQYRYATESRNYEFHKLFEEVPSNDRLLDDFSCALSREILLQGRLYISEHYLCFNSSLLGWITTLVISLDEIQKFERKATAGLFHNGIIIETREAKHVFASFISRDQTLNFIETVWSRSVSLSMQNNEKVREFESLSSKTSFDGLHNGAKLLTEEDLYTIDSDDSSEEFDHAEVAGNITDGNDTLDKHIEKLQKVRKSPKKHEPSTYRYDYEGNNEAIMIEEEYDVPVGEIFKVMFGDDLTFHKKSMEMNDGMEFTEYTGLHHEGDERQFEYDKKLNYPIGPSSTRVFVTEIVEHMDVSDYVEVVNISKTPNVPSGTAFDCRTRFVISWTNNGKSKLIISYKLNWTGSSWFKSVIESSALSGQRKAADDMHNELVKEVPKIKSLMVVDDDEADDDEHNAENDETDVEEMVKSGVQSIKDEKREVPATQVKPIVDEFSLSKQLIRLPIGTFKFSTIISCFVAFTAIQFLLIGYLGYANYQLVNKLLQIKEIQQISDFGPL